MKFQFALVAGVVAGLAATTANAQHANPSGFGLTADGINWTGLSSGLAGTTNSVINVNVSGAECWGEPGDPGNTVMLIDLASILGLNAGSAVTITSIGWNTTQTAFSPSWLVDMSITFDNDLQNDPTGIFLTPVNTQAPGGPTASSSGGQIDLTTAVGANIPLYNGVLRLEFIDTFEDIGGSAEGVFGAGSVLTIGTLEAAVPAPGALAVFGLAGLMGSRRRRS